MIKQAIEFVDSQVNRPAISSKTLPQEIKNKVASSQQRILSFRRIGDLYNYLRRFHMQGETENLEVHHALVANGLESYEKIRPTFEQKFRDYLGDVTRLEDFIVGHDYTSWDISNFTQVYNNQVSIMGIGEGPIYRAVFVKGELGGKKYKNAWIVPGLELKYYFYSLKGNFDPSYELNQKVLRTEKSQTPIFVFLKRVSEYRFDGIYKLKQSVDENDGSRWFHFIKPESVPLGVTIRDNQLYADLEARVSAAKTLTLAEPKVAYGSERPQKIMTVSVQYVRDPEVIAYVLNRASGTCEECKSPAPFKRATDGSPYLEVHHIKRLADGGADTIGNAAALCPNCHRKAHFG